MSSPRQRPWHHDVRQYTLLEFSKLKRVGPDGVYITLYQGEATQWQGVLFVREGPYSPAILRFQILFPPDYPISPPTISFTSDVFHPLVTPLTTYTYTTGSTLSDPVSATDEERLPPGGFSLGHGFPRWFGRAPKSGVSSVASSRKVSATIEGGEVQGEIVEKKPVGIEDISKEQKSEALPVMPESSNAPTKQNETILKYGIIEVLHYIKRAFSDESALDNLPLEAAGNAGAWKAWRAHRITKGAIVADTVLRSEEAHHDEWNWDGVWEERVRRGIDASISESVLFGSAPSSLDQIRFANLEGDLIDEIRACVLDSPPANTTA